jgi:folate-dependent phosphoribosylglycinamide formyltransferase PurN
MKKMDDMTKKLGKNCRVMVMCCEGMYQRYLCERIAREYQLVGIVKHNDPNSKGSIFVRLKRYIYPKTLLNHVLARLFMLRYQKVAEPFIRRLFYANGSSTTFPKDVPSITVADINSEKVVDFVRKYAPEVVCVNGTNLLRNPMLDLIPSIPFGIINLHTGLSPYSRGGNCNLYMLLEGHPELVGLTIHHIDSGIDSGDIIISARPEMGPDDNYEIIDAKTFRLGIDLMIIALHQLLEGRALRIKQWEEGKLFLRRTGYVYNPFHRVSVNRVLKKGLIRNYLKNRAVVDQGIRLVGDQF